MDGIFARKKTNIWLVLVLLCGIFFIGLYFYSRYYDPNITDAPTFLVLGILFSLIAVPALLLNHCAYIHIDDTAVKAKYHWFGRLDCRIEDVEFSYSQVNSITLLLKNGKRHTIMGVENAKVLNSYIRKLDYHIETESAESIHNKLEQVQAKQKKQIWMLVCGCGLLFFNIFLTVLLTGGKDLGGFGKTDWIIFAVMGFVELVTIIALFVFADRCGKTLLPIEQQKYRLRGAVLRSEPLPYNNTIAVYVDENHSVRIVVCGFPNDEGVYYCVQEIIGNYRLEIVHTSKIFDSINALMEEGISNFIEITPYL